LLVTLKEEFEKIYLIENKDNAYVALNKLKKIVGLQGEMLSDMKYYKKRVSTVAKLKHAIQKYPTFEKKSDFVDH
jgi:hypothetical protein